MTKQKSKLFEKVGIAVTEGIASVGQTNILKNQIENIIIEQVTLPIRNLPSRFDGFRIVLMSDFHLYPITTIEVVERSVQLANDLDADLIALTGDYVWREPEAIFELAPALAKLNARYGIYATLGNHDIWTNTDMISTAFQEHNLDMLVNEHAVISQADETLYIAGLDDAWAGDADINKTLDGIPYDGTAIVLSHIPDVIDEYAEDPRVVLQLSGHTHGGQVRMKNAGAIALPYLGKKYDYQLYTVNDVWLYTNPGIGTTVIPVRYNCPPEITELTLTCA